jgi:hypothetical protein
MNENKFTTKEDQTQSHDDRTDSSPDYNFIVSSKYAFGHDGHIPASELMGRIVTHDGSSAYHCAFNLEKRETFKKYCGKVGPALGRIWFDLDGGNALKDVRAFVKWLNVNDLVIFFSGNKGFHVGLPFFYLPLLFDEFYNRRLNDLACELSKNYSSFDTSVYNAARKFRLPGSVHEKSGLFKIPLSYEELFSFSIDDITALACNRRTIQPFDISLNEESKPLPHLVNFAAEFTRKTYKFHFEEADDSLLGKMQSHRKKVCIQRLESELTPGGHLQNVALRLCSDYKNCGVPIDDARKRLVKWCAINSITDGRPEAVLDQVYSGESYGFGCNDEYKSSKCSGKCAIYKFLSKKTRPLALDAPSKMMDEQPSQVTSLLKLCDSIELFHTSEGNAYATVPVDDHKETWALKSQGFRRWLLHGFYSQFGSAPCSQAMQDAIGTLGAKAQFHGENLPIFLRIASHDGKVYVDLSNQEWEVVEISASGWNVIKESPAKFIRSKRMLPLPHPARVTSRNGIEELKKFLNVESEESFKLIVAWIINAFNPNGPYLALVLYGEQGSAKSTTVRIIRSVIDPNEAPLRREPKNADDLMVSAKGNWVVAIDNMSHLPDWLSDDFCRLATGGGLSKREHYSDDEEVVLNAKRPIILNGIDEFVARGDLASRTITLHLPTISEGLRKRESTLGTELDNARPRILGVIFDAVSSALNHQDTFELKENLRMADAWHWISAAESAFGWERETIVSAFRANQANSNDIVLNSSVIYPFIRELSEIGWSGTATNLLSRLNSMRRSNAEFDRFWPKNPKNLTDRIRRINPALKLAEIDVIFSKTTGSNSERMVTIRKVEKSYDASDATTQTDKKCAESDEEKCASSAFPSFIKTVEDVTRLY